MRFKLMTLVGMLFVVNSCSDYTNDPVPSSAGGGSAGGVTKPINRPLPAEYQNPNSGAFSAEKMLVNIGINVIAKNVEDFYFKAGTLQSALGEYCQEINLTENNTRTVLQAENKAKASWKDAMIAFHKVSMSGIGPLTDNNKAIYNKIYSWPVVSECGIDQEVIKNTNSQLPEGTLANRRSLSAIEYLLYEQTLVSKCSAFAEPKAKEWSEKSVLEKKKDRCAYALNVARDVQKNAELIRNTWSPDKENYTVALIDKSIYSDTNKAVNALTDSLFAFEDFRDTDLAIPLGIHADCKNSTGKCIENLEHPWSGITAEAAIAQIQGFQEAFMGSKNDSDLAFGLDDYLLSKGHKEIADDIKNNLALSLQGMQQLADQDPALRTTILNAKKENCNIFEAPKESLDFVCQVYKDIQNVTFTLKTDVMIVLALQAPTGHAGDND